MRLDGFILHPKQLRKFHIHCKFLSVETALLHRSFIVQFVNNGKNMVK